MSCVQYQDSFFQNLDEKIEVNQKPYPHASIKNFLPKDLCSKISKDFKIPEKDSNAGIEDKVFQKTKKGLSKIDLMPASIKDLIERLNSPRFISILEKKFEIKNLVADPSLFGGGLHESFR